MTTKREKIQGRLLYIILWLPVLLIPAMYLMLLYLTGSDTSEQGAWDTVDFLMPFLIVFIIHDRLLLKYLFLQGRFWAYGLSVVVLLTGFLMLNQSPDHKENKGEGRPPALTERRETPPPMPRNGMERDGEPSPPRTKKHKGRRNMPDPEVMDFITAALLLGSNLAVALFIRYSQEKRRNAELENSKLHQELEYLKAQINPHFFMNMLNNIHGMVEIDTTKAQEMIMQLSHLMRYVLYEGSRQFTPLNEEVKFISNYVELMSKRYSSRKVDMELHLPQQPVDGIEIPPLLFIVLIENAFKHGVSYREQSSFFISMQLKDGRVVFVCRNRRFKHKEGTKKPGGIGLANLRKRLQLLYGDNHTLIIEELENTYTATLIIPYKK